MQDTFARLRREARAHGGLRGELAVWWREVSQMYRVGRFEKTSRAVPSTPVADRSDANEAPAVSTDMMLRRPMMPGSWPGGVNLRQTLRSLRRSPGFAAIVIVTLALGVGANATMFGIIDRLLLQEPEHIVEADRVTRIYVERGFAGQNFVSSTIAYPDFVDFAASNELAGTAAFRHREITWGHGETAARVRGMLTTASLFPLLGAQPLMGRFFAPEDDAAGRASVVVLGHDFWLRRGADSSVLGTEIVLGGAPHTIVGVAPSGFTGIDLERVDVWLPLHSPANSAPPIWETSRGFYWLRSAARLAEGATTESAEAEATALHRSGRADDKFYDPEASVVLGALVEARGTQRSAESVVARWLAGVSLVVLMVACANVANMLLARSVQQRREIGIRLALGVSRGRLIAQQLGESVVLAAFGGAAALAVTYWGGLAVRAVLLPDIHWPHSPLDVRVMAFTFSAALVAGIVAGLVPAVQATRQNVVSVIKGGNVDGGQAQARARSLLLVGQAALSVVLLVGAGLFVRSIARLQAVDLGFDPERIVVAIPEFDSEEIPDNQKAAFYDAALDRLRTLPAVEGIAASAALPFYWTMTTGFQIPGREELPTFGDGGPYLYPVTNDYLSTTGIDIVKGRGFDASDDARSARVAVVGEVMANAYWPGEDPLGKCVYIGDNEVCTEIIGVAERASRASIQGSDSAQYYVPISQWSDEYVPRALLARSGSAELDALVSAVRREILSVSPIVRFVEVQGFGGLIDPQARSWELGATLFSVFGLLAVVIAAVGLYGVLAFGVAQRRHEIGVRSALGASPGGLVALVGWQAARLVTAGLLIGIAAALFAAPRIEPLLFDVNPRDPSVLASVALILAAVAAVAATLPAMRAARVQPVIALRQS